MDRRRSAAAERVFEDFEPAVEWKLAGEEQDVVEISLPGFRKDQVRVQVDNHGVLRAIGERPTRGGRWARFKKDLRLPDNCDTDGVRARFEGEKLIITLPIAAVGSSEADAGVADAAPESGAEEPVVPEEQATLCGHRAPRWCHQLWRKRTRWKRLSVRNHDLKPSESSASGAMKWWSWKRRTPLGR